ncbi:type II toxin-antitoxin system Phd/YefM family antitoxin [Candidatus Uhrbacteria bacterium]|nr:type II toxin-antitoxin system Phd/YefM family antitoxin [Candidatus Uhrbacteria bacterium]
MKHPKFNYNEEFANIQEVQAGTSKLLDRAAKRGTYIRVIKNSKPIGVLMPNETFERLTEDLLALSSPPYLQAIAQARKEKKRYSSKQVKKMLGLE